MRALSHKLLSGVLIATAVLTSGWTARSIERQAKTQPRLHMAQVPRRPASTKASAVQRNTNSQTAAQVPSPAQKTITIVADKTVIQLGETVNFHLEPQQLVARIPYRFVFHFDDGATQEFKDRQQPLSHRYSSAGRHAVSVIAEAPPGVAPDEEGI